MRDALGCPGPTVKSDIIARKANQAASQTLFRLYTTHQPEGNRERNLVLSNLQKPHVVQDAASGVSALRAWGRWYQRCIDFGMSLPDPMVLVGGLTSMTKPVISKEPEGFMANRDGQKCCSCTVDPRKRRSNPTTNICWPSLRLWLEHRLPKWEDQATLP